MSKSSNLTFEIFIKNNMRSGTFEILGKKGQIPSQIITTLNIEQAKLAERPNFDFGSNILEITELDPSKLNDKSYQQIRIEQINQTIKDHPDKLCIFGIKGLKKFRVDKEKNEFLIEFQIACGFNIIQAYFKNIRNAKDDLIYFRKLVKSKEKFFVACVDEKLPYAIFESLYLDCLENKDEIISFFGRRRNFQNDENYNLIQERLEDKILRFSLSISKSYQGMANSIMYNALGFDCFSFSRKISTNHRVGRLVALDKLRFKILIKNTKLICVLSGENLYDSSQKFKKTHKYEYLPIQVHDMVRLNQLLKKIHIIYTREKLLKLFNID